MKLVQTACAGVLHRRWRDQTLPGCNDDSATRTVNGRLLLLIEADETHEISNPGPNPLVTVNVYAPPAY